MATHRLAAPIALLLLAGPVRTAAWEEGSRPLTGIVRVGVDFGGTLLATASNSPGPGVEDQRRISMRAGQLITFSVGALAAPRGPFSIEATAGYKFDKLSASGETVSFSRFPVDLVASVAGRSHRLGVGPTFHLSPRLSGSPRSTFGPPLEYPMAVGGLVQYAWRSGQRYGMEAGARVTWISYRGAGLPSLDGNCFGVFVGVWL